MTDSGDFLLFESARGDKVRRMTSKEAGAWARRHGANTMPAMEENDRQNPNNMRYRSLALTDPDIA